MLNAILTFYGLTNINSERKHSATAGSIKHTQRDGGRTPSRNYLHYDPRDAPARRGVFSQHIRATAPLRGRGSGSDDNFQREYFPRDETTPNATRERVPRVFAAPLPRRRTRRSRPLSYIFHYVPQDFPRPRESAPGRACKLAAFVATRSTRLAKGWTGEGNSVLTSHRLFQQV